MCSKDGEQAFAKVPPASVSVHARLLHLPPHPTPTPRTGRGRKAETQALNTDTLRRVSSWQRHANASEKPCWRRRRTPYNFPPPGVSKWYYLLRHRLPDIVLHAAPQPSIRSPIGHRISDVSASRRTPSGHGLDRAETLSINVAWHYICLCESWNWGFHYKKMQEKPKYHINCFNCPSGANTADGSCSQVKGFRSRTPK